MGSFTALVLATPVFGLSLAPPTALPLYLSPLVDTTSVATPAGWGVATPGLTGQAFRNAQRADDEEDDESEDEEELDEDEGLGEEGEGAADEESDLDDLDDEDIEEIEVDLGGGDDADVDMAEYGRMIQERAELAEIHRPLGIATWAAMGITLLLGGIQYHNLYGTFGSLEDTPCVQGDAIFGQGQCSGTPWAHLISSMVTTALYTATFTVATLMPDPGDLDEGDSDYASNLRTHKILRWIHFGGMLAQVALGIIIANSENFGLDRANDFGTLQALSTVHMALGLVTFGAMTWAGALFTL